MERNIQNREKVQAAIKGINIIEIRLRTPEKQLNINAKFNYNIGFKHILNIEMNFITVIVNIVIGSDEIEDELGRYEIGVIFNVPMINEYYDKEENRLDSDLLSNLNIISLDTTRGIMFSVNRGTFLHNAILPLVSPESITTKKE